MGVMAVTAGLGGHGLMPLPGGLLTLVVLVALALTLVGFVWLGGDCSDLGLVLRFEGGDCLVEGHGGDLGLGDDGDGDRLGGQVHSIGGLKNVFVGGG